MLAANKSSSSSFTLPNPKLMEVDSQQIFINSFFNFFWNADQAEDQLGLQPMVLWQHNQNYWLVQGLKQLKDVQKQGLKCCAALVFMNVQEPVELWKNLAEIKQPKSLLSKAQALQGLHKEVQPKKFDALFEQLKPLSWVNNKNAQRQLLFLIQHQQLLSGFVNTATATSNDIKLLQGYSLADLCIFAEMFAGWQLHGNKLRLLLGMLNDIKIGRKLSLKEVQSAVQKIKIAGDTNQQYHQTTEILQTLRYPNWTQLQAEWQAAVKSLKLPKEVSFLPNADFEMEELSILIRSQTPSQLKMVLADLQKKLDHPDSEKNFKKIYQWF